MILSVNLTVNIKPSFSCRSARLVVLLMILKLISLIGNSERIDFKNKSTVTFRFI